MPGTPLKQGLEFEDDLLIPPPCGVVPEGKPNHSSSLRSTIEREALPFNLGLKGRGDFNHGLKAPG